MRDWIITKRQMGLLFLIAGIIGSVGVLALDVLRGSSDFGPTQFAALIGCAVIALIGLTLIPLGDRPA